MQYNKSKIIATALAIQKSWTSGGENNAPIPKAMVFVNDVIVIDGPTSFNNYD